MIMTRHRPPAWRPTYFYRPARTLTEHKLFSGIEDTYTDKNRLFPCVRVAGLNVSRESITELTSDMIRSVLFYGLLTD